MTSKDDSIQLIELASNSSPECISRIQSPTFSKLKKKNKVQSPVLSSNFSSSPSSSKRSDVFVVKPTIEYVKKSKPTPIPKPRASIQTKPSSSNDIDKNDNTTSPKLEYLQDTKPTPKPRSRNQFKAFTISSVDESEENVASPKTIESTSGDVQSIFSHKSDISYKEKLRNRFLAVKKEAEISIQNEKRNSKKKKLSEAIDAIIKEEDSHIQSQIDKRAQITSKWSDVQSADDFFCNVFDDENVNNDKEEEIVVEEIEDGKQSIAELLGLESDLEPTDFVFPDIIDVTSNEKLMFRSLKSIYRKTNEVSFELRNFEEEGIYVPNQRHISKYQLKVLENRLFEEDRDWFGPDGQLKILPDPRLDYSVKLLETETKHSDFVKYTPPTIYEPADIYINIYDNTLEFNLNKIYFRHHPLFSTEHVLEQNLISLYKKYSDIISKGLFIVCTKKLNALRVTKNQHKQLIKTSKESNEDEMKQYVLCLSEIKSVRERIYKYGKKERILKKSIIFVWKYLKNLRATQKYSNTAIKLIILKEKTDYDSELKEWERNIEEETSEILEEYESIFETKLKEYKKLLNEWKQQQRELNDDEIVNEMLIEKPKKPKRNYTEEQIVDDVIKRCTESLKPPGEPILCFELKFDNEISEDMENEEEILRRQNVYKTKIFIKILYNQQEICKSKSVPLNNRFICCFNENISLKLLKLPNTLSVQVFEYVNISKKLLSEIFVPIPDVQFNIDDAKDESEDFQKSEIINFNHAGVGTGLQLKQIIDLPNIDEEEKLFLHGCMEYQLGWSKKNVESIINKSDDSVSHIKIPTLFDIENLEEWVKHYPDPQDPRNAFIFDYIKYLDLKNNKKDYFRCDPDMTALEFCSFEEIDNNLRFRLLNLRFNNEPEFKNIVVPNRVKEISPEIFKSYDRRKNEEKLNHEILLSHFQQDVDIDSHRKWATKFLEQADNKILQLNKVAEKKITVRDILNEENIPTIGTLGWTFLNWFQPKRPLRPSRKTSKPVASSINLRDMHILVNIIGAIQIPARKNQTLVEQSPLRIDEMHIVSVRPFVTVSFRDISLKTTVAEGPNPIWNEELNLPLQNKKEILTISSLQNIKDSIIINLYDETIDDLTIDDRIQETNIHQQIGYNWLGYIEIPFKTLLYNNRIEGTFKVNLPTILLGYERQTLKSLQPSGEPLTQKIDTFLTMFLTLQPTPSNLQYEVTSNLPCNELEYVKDYIINWQNNFNSLYPQRKFSSLVTTLNGETTCITRFFQKIPLPQFENSEFIDLQCAKYVSLIPFRENNFAGLIPDIWLTPNQLLTTTMGTIKDHAVLLTCYFMTLNIKTWFLYGFSLYDGYTAYVLVQEKYLKDEFSIYDVKSGLKYNICNSLSPLQKIFFVANNENVWANVQCDDRIHQTQFNFSKTSDWLPLFGKDISVPPSLQQLNPTYFDSPLVILLQERIEKKLRKKIMTWRKFSRTTWNHYCNASFKQILAKLEASNYKENGFSNPDHILDLQNVLSTYQIRGFAISFPYTTLKTLIEYLKKTGMHLNDHPNIEFALSVFVHAYNNNVIIVWLFVANLIRTR